MQSLINSPSPLISYDADELNNKQKQEGNELYLIPITLA
jgi:hypothetical protein